MNRLLAISLSTFLAHSAISSAVSAQTIIPPEKRRGLASSLSLAFVGANDQSRIMVSPPGSLGTPAPYDPLMTNVPADYSTVFEGIPNIEIDALSTGNDFIGATIGSANAVGANLEDPARWQAICVTLEDGATNTSSGPSILPMITETDSTIISHYQRGDTAPIPGGYDDTTHAEQLPINVFGPTAPSQSIVALDFALGALAAAAGNAASSMPTSVVFPHGLGEIYFSVTPAWASTAPANALGGIAIDPAAVYVRRWEQDPPGSGSFSWSDVEVELTPAELGLSAGDDVDALAYDKPKGVAVYSTQVVAGRSQLLVFDATENVPTLGGPPVTFVAIDSATGLSEGSLMDKLTIDETNNVTSTCSIDPGFELAQAIDSVMAQPIPTSVTLGPGEETVGISVSRWSDDGGEYLTIQATGLGDIPTALSPAAYGVLFIGDQTIFEVSPSLQLFDASTGQCEWRIPSKRGTHIFRVGVVDFVGGTPGLPIPGTAWKYQTSCRVRIDI